MHLSSSKGPIDVFLCTDTSGESSSPLRNGVDVNGNDTSFILMSRGEHDLVLCCVCVLIGGVLMFIWLYVNPGRYLLQKTAKTEK